MRAFEPSLYDLSSCMDDAGRARWLLHCPLAAILLHERLIRGMLELDSFHAGIAYLDTMIAIIREKRRPDGRLQNFMAFCVANGRIRRIAESLPQTGLGGG